ncbi:hypothetical protein COLO4_11651 [Corchorus olitorius]|uniref:Uncharacterized protein n=1 Tax=Corchorus olitorius TaxID=93759 RepID=A0A1R3K3T0_9ROSI|nr:hypothetical protein COLO4_11651 [Corchorus olitorius]
MEQKKKCQKLVTSSGQEPDSNELLGKEDENQSKEALAAKNTITDSLSEENLSSFNEQYPNNILQWTYTKTTQNATEQASLNPRPCAPSPWQQVTPLQPNSSNHLAQQGQPTLHLAQSNTPFWLQHRPSFPFPAVNAPAAATFQPFTSITTVDGSWQPPAIIGGTTSRNQQQVPICYHYGPYPGFPGHWDPSSCWGHGQQSQPSFNCTFPGAYGYFSSPPPLMPNCSATFAESSQRGIIRPTVKLSQKHQQLWEAQSIENVQLWSVINQLQSEVADYKSRLTKLEAEVSSLKLSPDDPNTRVIRTGLSGSATKRGRPKRSVASVDVSASPDESHPRAKSRKRAATKAQPAEARVLVFDNVALSNLEDRQKAVQSNSSNQKDNGEKIPFVITNSSSFLEMSALNNQIHQEGQIVGIGTNSSLEMKSNGDKGHESKTTAPSVLSLQHKETNKGGSVTNMGGTTNGETLTWPMSQSFYSNGCLNLIRQAGKFTPGWRFGNEDSDHELEVDAAAAAGSAKDDENEEEIMGDDDASSGGEEEEEEETAQTKDNTLGTNPKDLPPYNWS